jgi:hypothetical protein
MEKLVLGRLQVSLKSSGILQTFDFVHYIDTGMPFRSGAAAEEPAFSYTREGERSITAAEPCPEA